MNEKETATSCEKFQIALEKKAAGTLSEDEMAELAQHVRGCSSCQRVAQLIESLRTMKIPERPTAAMDVVRARLVHRRRYYWLMVALYAVLTAGAFVVFGTNGGLIHLGAGLFAIGVTTYGYRKLNKLAAQHAESQTEIIGEFQKEVRGRLQLLERRAFLFVPLVFAFSGAQDLFQGRSLIGGYTIALAVLMFAVWLRARLVHLPRLRRELAELSRS